MDRPEKIVSVLQANDHNIHDWLWTKMVSSQDFEPIEMIV
jgi:hypothetical protein